MTSRAHLTHLPSTARRTWTLLALTLLVLGLGACTGYDTTGNPGSADRMSTIEGTGNEASADQPATAAEPAVDSMSAEGQASRPEPALQQRAVISTADVRLEAADVPRALVEVRAVVDRLGGQISSEESRAGSPGSTGYPGSAYSSLTVRVPVDRFDPTLEALSAIKTAHLVSSTRSSEDVTTQVIDVEARIASQEASLRRVRVLFSKAESIADIAAIESELTRRQADLDSLRGQQAWLKDQTSLSTITVSIDQTGVETEVDEGGFLGGLRAGWEALATSATAVSVVVGATLPWLVVLVPLVTVLWVVRRRVVTRRAREAAEAQPPTG